MKLKKLGTALVLWISLWLVAPPFPMANAQVTAPATNAVTIRAEVQVPDAGQTLAAQVQAAGRPLVMTFGLDRISFLQPSLFGMPRWKYLASLIFVVLAVGAAKLLDVIVGFWLRRWNVQGGHRLGGLALNLIHGPVKVVTFVLLLHIGLELLDWPVLVQVWLRRALWLVVACSLTYMTLKLIDVVVEHWRQRVLAREDRQFNEQLFPVVSNSLKVFLVIVAILVTSQNLGLNITAMLASLSIGGLALGLAAQDTVANLFGAVAVFVDKPFRVGDRIRLDSIDGVVESIGLRSTRVRNLDGYLITVPNKTMGNATITNITRRPAIKTEMNIGITYDTPAEKVKAALSILEEIYRQHPMTQDLTISFNRFGDSALNINVVHWWGNTDNRAYLKGMQDLNLAIKQRFDQEKIDFAFPTQTLYVKPEPNGRLDQLVGSPLPSGRS